MNRTYDLSGPDVLARYPEFSRADITARLLALHGAGDHEGRSGAFPLCLHCQRGAYKRLGLIEPWKGQHTIGGFLFAIGTFVLVAYGAPLWGGLFVGSFGPGLNRTITEGSGLLLLAGLVGIFISLRARREGWAYVCGIVPLILIGLTATVHA